MMRQKIEHISRGGKQTWSQRWENSFADDTNQELAPGFRHNDPMQGYRPGKEWLENCPAGKGTSVLVNSWLNTGQQRAQVAKMTSSIPIWVSSGVDTGAGK